ncbi:seven-hairpin glycosidase [Zalerion maritima]|uniref:alpha-1,2-Mannosidase n=1 Tax=Zalerion maritima TaxID=339359 RepID=A0AAD5WPH1_9PEZI|nr:seven-hairpin glycosidase [Zalerion maritima]
MRRSWRPVLLTSLVWTCGLWYLYRSGQRQPYFQPTPESKVLGIARWQSLPEINPLPRDTVLRKIPRDLPPEPIPRIQAPAPGEEREARNRRLHRREAVRGAFRHSWKGYRNHAWMHDEVKPLTGAPSDPLAGWGATLVDSLDTLWIMELKNEFDEAVQAAARIDFTTYAPMGELNVFETNIRHLAGLMSAYEVSGKKHKILLQQAALVGDILMSAFDTPNRMPITRWDIHHWLNSGLRSSTPQTAPSQVLASEIGSLSLEFTKLSQLTGKDKYYDAVQRVSDELAKAQSKTNIPGLWPIVVNARDLTFNADSTFTLGGMADSLYEYLPKQYLLLGGALAQPREMYEGFIDVAKKRMLRRALNPANESIVFSGDIKEKDGAIEYIPKGQHLGCFVAGMVGLGARLFDRGEEEVGLAGELARGCVWSYDATPCGIGPEIWHYVPCAEVDEEGRDEKCEWSREKWMAGLEKQWMPNVAGENVDEEELVRIAEKKQLPLGMTDVPDRKYILRPEAIEAVFWMHRLTGDVEWQDIAWRMFEKVEELTKSEFGAAALEDVTELLGKPRRMNNQESFWLAETLKYFYLCFSEFDVVSLDEWVLNTEAHPFKRMDLK